MPRLLKCKCALWFYVKGLLSASGLLKTQSLLDPLWNLQFRPTNCPALMDIIKLGCIKHGLVSESCE